MADASLPMSLVTASDLKRLRREIEALDDFMHQAGLRQGGKPVKLPSLSRSLEELTAASNLNLLKATDRARLLKYVTLLAQKAPVIHMSFASEPSLQFLSKLAVWLRSNVHPQAVIAVGLQPSITAGCVVRTNNKQFDFSLREAFESKRGLLIDALLKGDDSEKSATPKGDTTGNQEAATGTPESVATAQSPASATTAKSPAAQPAGAAS